VYISPNAEFTPKNVQTKEERTKLVFGVKIEVENPDGVLKPGLPADARLVIGQ
jgi:HlyD family secretion protein